MINKLKENTLVLLRNNTKYIVVKENNKFFVELAENNETAIRRFELEDFNENLTNKYKSEYDIIQILNNKGYANE